MTTSRAGDSTLVLAVCSVLVADVSLVLQQCCDCCSLGLRLRSEGKSCESNINLGYPCSHVMLSCCEGGDPLAQPEIRRHPQPLPTATPEKGEWPWGLGPCTQGLCPTHTFRREQGPHTSLGGRGTSHRPSGSCWRGHQEHSCFPLTSSTGFLIPKAGWKKEGRCGCFSSSNIAEASLSKELRLHVLKKS